VFGRVIWEELPLHGFAPGNKNMGREEEYCTIELEITHLNMMLTLLAQPA
jgi:hypothetical protein